MKSVINKELHVFLGQFGINSLVSFQKHKEIALTNFIMFLRTNLGYLSQIALKNMQLLIQSVSKLFENVEWSHSLLRHFKIQTLSKINCCMAAIIILMSRNTARFFHFSFEIEISALRFINYTIHRLHSTNVVATSALKYPHGAAFVIKTLIKKKVTQDVFRNGVMSLLFFKE